MREKDERFSSATLELYFLGYGFDLGLAQIPPHAYTVKRGFFMLPLGPEEVYNFAVVFIIKEIIIKLPVGAPSMLRGRKL